MESQKTASPPHGSPSPSASLWKTQPLSTSFPTPATQPWVRSLIRALANKFTLWRCPQGREAPKASAVLLKRSSLLALCKMLLHSPCQYLSKRHTQLSGQYAPRVTLGLWVGSLFFICFCFCFKVMFLSPFNGEYATWLMMCFQTCRFSDNS